MNNASPGPRPSNSLSNDITMKETESETLVLRSRPRLGRDLDGSLDIGFTGSHLNDKPEPLAPIPQEDDIYLDPQGDHASHGSPHLSFELDQSRLDFTLASAGNNGWTNRIGGQNGASFSPRQRSFSELVAPPGSSQHLTVIPHRHKYGGSTASSATSNSFVQLTPQGSSQPSLAQAPGSNAAASLISDSAGGYSPRVSTPGHHSQDGSHKSPLGHPPQTQPRVGPSQNWEIRPRVSDVPACILSSIDFGS